MSSTGMVTLRDGSQVPEGNLLIISNTLSYLQKEHPLALWDLAMKCHDSAHLIIVDEMFGNHALKALKLLNRDDTVPSDIRNIVVNSVVSYDNNISFQLQNPRQQRSWCIIL
jgi:hypothetical protein